MQVWSADVPSRVRPFLGDCCAPHPQRLCCWLAHVAVAALTIMLQQFTVTSVWRKSVCSTHYVMYPYQKASVGMKECVDIMSAHSEICRSHKLFDLVSGCCCEPCNDKLLYILCDLLLSPDVTDSFVIYLNRLSVSLTIPFNRSYIGTVSLSCVSCRARQWDASVQAGEGEAGLHHASEHTLLCQGCLA